MRINADERTFCEATQRYYSTLPGIMTFRFVGDSVQYLPYLYFPTFCKYRGKNGGLSARRWLSNLKFA
ncbi:hypothetical protein M413DRAFT_317260 [Hebeloma cylindrosporum]|uniref:Uncharacterized protein n=1 Tax=Hebeloma cylindrosporum TaxID=76867 RepID=A0A0C3CRI9_HEBCY|nr:hypothetical protein M413DRAFT_317260 [Hebeloma cylindrosporum h7]